MEGVLTVPPDRGTIIGRALWKPRYIVVGDAQRDLRQQSSASVRTQTSRTPIGKPQPRSPHEGTYLSIYKSAEDWEPIQQHAISSVTLCEVQMLAHRKQGPVLATLVINISPDPATDKLRKRRSSRTAGLTSTKETAPSTLWFRPGDEQYTLHDWARFIQPLLPPSAPDKAPMSPLSPMSPTFINPFAPSPSRSNHFDPSQRPGSSTAGADPRGIFQRGNSNQSQQTRERPVTYSDSPSLRSRRSDVSSHTSSMHPSRMAIQNYTSVHPADLPSPAATVSEYQGGFIEGWTSAQGRSSTLSSPIRGRDSISSQPPPSAQPSIDSSSPPGPRETILDRAFQLRYIPGSEQEVPGEDKLTSLARFDALMREADDKRRARQAAEAKERTAAAAAAAAKDGMKSVWDLDEDSDEDDVDDEEGEFDDGEDSDGLVMEDDEEERRRGEDDSYMMPPTAQRALDYIQGKGSQSQHSQQQRRQRPPPAPPARTQSSRTPLSYDRETLMEMNSSPPYLRPHTGHGQRPTLSQRAHSQPQLAAQNSSHSASTLEVPLPEGAVALHRAATEKRLSTSSAKRLSFTEFAKRLSSTSSLLLVQTNQSGGSSRGSTEYEIQQQPAQTALKASASPRRPPHPSDRTTDDRCGFRGSVGVFGADGGFL